MAPSAHPYMASSAPELKQELLEATGAASVDELFEQIPASHRLRGELNLPPALASEVELRRHLLESLRKNVTCEETLSFLGGGCWQHHVPAICDELVSRTYALDKVNDALDALAASDGARGIIRW